MPRRGAWMLTFVAALAGCEAYNRGALDSGPRDPGDAVAVDDTGEEPDTAPGVEPDTGEDPTDAQVEPFDTGNEPPDAGNEPPDAGPSADSGARGDAGNDARSDAGNDARPPVVAAFQTGIAPTASYRGTSDTQLFQSQPTTNYGSLTTLRCDGDQPNGSGKDADFLVRWDVTAVPPRSIVRAAVIEFYVVDVSGSTFPLYELRRAWVPLQATWTRASLVSAWSAGGALGATDRGSVALGTFVPSTAGRVAVPLNSAGLAVVQRWVDQPSSNVGVLVASSTTNGLGVASSETATAAQRPRLTITYAPP